MTIDAFAEAVERQARRLQAELSIESVDGFAAAIRQLSAAHAGRADAAAALALKRRHWETLHALAAEGEPPPWLAGKAIEAGMALIGPSGDSEPEQVKLAKRGLLPLLRTQLEAAPAGQERAMWLDGEAQVLANSEGETDDSDDCFPYDPVCASNAIP